jgi:molybdenum cofactor synthesis domain-containing protein
MEIAGIQLIEKRGGKSDYAGMPATTLRAAVLVMSDSIAAGTQSDRSGCIIAERLGAAGVEVVDYAIIADEKEEIVRRLCHYADELALDMVVTTGGTGFSPRDVTPEAMAQVIERDVPGLPEAARAYGQQRTPFAMLSRGKAGIRGHTLIINLPGSTRGVTEALDALLPGVLHAFPMLRRDACVGFQVSGVGFQGLGFRVWVSGFGFQVSGFRFRISGFGFQVSGFRVWVSGFGRVGQVGRVGRV